MEKLTVPVQQGVMAMYTRYNVDIAKIISVIWALHK